MAAAWAIPTKGAASRVATRGAYSCHRHLRRARAICPPQLPRAALSPRLGCEARLCAPPPYHLPLTAPPLTAPPARLFDLAGRGFLAGVGAAQLEAAQLDLNSTQRRRPHVPTKVQHETPAGPRTHAVWLPRAGHTQHPPCNLPCLGRPHGRRRMARVYRMRMCTWRWCTCWAALPRKGSAVPCRKEGARVMHGVLCPAGVMRVVLWVAGGRRVVLWLARVMRVVLWLAGVMRVVLWLAGGRRSPHRARESSRRRREAASSTTRTSRCSAPPRRVRPRSAPVRHMTRPAFAACRCTGWGTGKRWEAFVGTPLPPRLDNRSARPSCVPPLLRAHPPVMGAALSSAPPWVVPPPPSVAPRPLLTAAPPGGL